MAQKGYKGPSGKSLWVNQHYAKGIEYSNDTHKEGLVKSLVNWDINPSGISLKPRTPLFSALLSIGNEVPKSLNNSTYMFNPIQSEDKEFFFEFGAERKDIETLTLFTGIANTAEDESGIYVVDGDTIRKDGIDYRLIGIDSPELYDDDGNENPLGVAAKEALESILFLDSTDSIVIRAVYDKNVEGSIDTYGRHIVWLELVNTTAGHGIYGNVWMLEQGHARLFGEYNFTDDWNGSAYPADTRVVVPYYSFVSNQTLSDARSTAYGLNRGLWDVESEGIVIATILQESQVTDNLPLGIYSKYKDAPLNSYQEYANSLKLPMFDLTNESHRINYTKVYEDLNLTYGKNINISVNKVLTTNQKHMLNRRSVYDPITRMPCTDSFLFIGTIQHDGIEVYSGLISLRYHVPLDGNIPRFDNWYFEMETYIDNVYKIKWENRLGSSTNLLDTNPSTVRSYYGEDADKEGYSEPVLITVLIKNSKGKIVEQIKKGEPYTVEPVVALPTFEPDNTNGHDGYGIKWSVWDGDSDTYLDENQTNGSNGWRIAWNANGERIIDMPKHGSDSIIFDHIDWAPITLEFVSRLENQTYNLIVGDGPFTWDKNTITVQCEIAKVRMNGNQPYLNVDVPSSPYWIGPQAVVEPIAGISMVAVTMDYEDNEVLQPNYQHAQDLLSCPKLTVYGTRLLLYGSPKANNIIYVSDYDGNIGYFPAKYALDRFSEKIIYVHVYHDYLIVFTVNNIYLVYPALDENNIEVLVTKLIMSNVTIKEEYINTIQNIGKDILFLSNADELRILRPNPYVENEGDLLIGTVSQNVKNLLIDPTQFITRRFQYYNRPIDIFNEEWKPTIETVVHVYKNEIYIYKSVSIPFQDDPYMYILIYDTVNRRWRIYDTVAMSFPYQIKVFDANEGPYILCRNHIGVEGGTTLMLFESLNLWQFDDGYGKLRDSKPVKVVGTIKTFVFNSALTTDSIDAIKTVKIPINAMLDPGYLEITPHLMKRFLQIKFVITNIDAVNIPVTFEFTVDGKVRQTANTLRMTQITDINNPEYGKIQTAYHFVPFEVAANEAIEDIGISFQEWQLGVSRFGPGNKIEVKMGISGRGKIPSLELGFEITGMFELFNYTIVYKEQSAR